MNAERTLVLDEEESARAQLNRRVGDRCGVKDNMKFIQVLHVLKCS